jgi:hypothetical protein
MEGVRKKSMGFEHPEIKYFHAAALPQINSFF